MPDMMRMLDRGAPMARMRLWAGGEFPYGQTLASEAVVAEWAGRTGHPTSYGLLGLSRRGVRYPVSAPDHGDQFMDALAGCNDTVRFGLPDLYRDAVESVLQLAGLLDLVVVVAAHGEVGSSQFAFRRLASFVAHVMPTDLGVSSDEEVWAVWDAAAEEWGAR